MFFSILTSFTSFRCVHLTIAKEPSLKMKHLVFFFTLIQKGTLHLLTIPVGCPAENRPSATMTCRKRVLLMGLFLFFGLISRLLVRSSIFQNPPLNSSVLLNWREARFFWCLLHVWNLRAFIWFHLSNSALLLFCLVLLLILSSPFFCFWPSLLPTFQKCL